MPSGSAASNGEDAGDPGVQAMRYSTARTPIRRIVAIDLALRAQTWPTDESPVRELEVYPQASTVAMTVCAHYAQM